MVILRGDIVLVILFADLVNMAENIETIKSRKEKIRILSSFIGKLSPTEAEIAARFLSGRIFREYEDLSLGVGWSTIKNALSLMKTAPLLLGAGKPTIEEVYQVLEKVARVSGESSRQKKISYIYSLISRMGEEEIDFLLRVIFGEVRIGASTGLLLEAISVLTGCSLDEVRRAYMFLPDIGDLARIAVEGGCEKIKEVSLQVFRPVKPMLADMAYSVKEILSEHGGTTSLEYKYDGFRVQIHLKNDKVKVFSRRLSDITEYVPDIVEQVKENVVADRAVLDGEALGIVEGRPLPFQEITRRIRRKVDFTLFLKKIPYTLHLFDILYLNNSVLVDRSYNERREILEKIIRSEHILAERKVVHDLAEAESVYKKALEKGHEGVVAKRLDSIYEPGIRGRSWLKLKQSDTIDCVIVAAEWGHGRRRGWLSDYHLAVLDEDSGDYVRVGKTFKGLSDAEFEEMTRRLLEIKVREEGYVVHVLPRIVVEVEYSEIQKSQRYKSGFALRFARIKRIRWDKDPREITTLGELKRRYEKQARRKTG